MEQVNQSRPRGISIVAVVMILFGLAEVVTGFTHNFFGITTTSRTVFTSSAVAIGVFYAAAGLLMADVVGRVALAVTGLSPTDSFLNIFTISGGTIIVVIFAIYIGWKGKSFR
jgi:hypothetical protein